MSTTNVAQLAGKVALITGGSRGLGAEIAWAFARAGADVVISSRKLDPCVELADRIHAEIGVQTLGLAAHVGDWGALPDLVDAVYDRFGHLDILVNNAGIAPTYPSLEEVSEELFDKVVDVNLKGPFRLTALVASRMSVDRGGSIINISSIASQRPTARDLPYAAAKAGLNIATKGFAQAYGPNVRVNTIMAGPFFTDISRSWDMDRFERLAQGWPMQRGGNPAEIAGAALYLASDAASFTTGALLPVDGGRLAAE